MGDIYSGCAYYGDSGVKTAGFWAINLATGVPTRLGTIDVTGTGSWGLWTVKEVDGFLYVHTTHDGIYVYRMTDATTLGILHTRYTKERLDALAEDTNPNWGFDVVDDGARMLLSAGLGRVIEIIDSRIADATNGAGQLYVAVEDSAGKNAVVTNTDATLVTKTVWTEWKVPMSRFTGVNPAGIRKWYIGVGDRTSPKAGGFGRLYIDDIRVVKP